MRARPVTRRRAISLFAATSASLLTGGVSGRAAETYEWRGVAMGADARIVFSGVDGTRARAAIAAIVPEIDRLEQALSLFRADSQICRLNRDGVLQQPSGDLRAALALALKVAEASGGLFDPTVQALWEAHVDWFSAHPDGGLPSDRIVAAARRRVDWRQIALSPAAIRLGEGQRITLNGLGQGYVTDRVAELLRRRGFLHVLVDLGEQHALGPQHDGAAWIVARSGAEPIALREGALATSEGSGCVFGAGGQAHHLFDPRSGRSASAWTRVTVRHSSAAVADALSTALYAATEQEIGRIVRHFPGTLALATTQGGGEICRATPAADDACPAGSSRPL